MNNNIHPDSAVQAVVKKRKLLSPVWIVPFLAVFIAAYLAWQTIAEQGPTITITFNSAEGLVAGQTQIKYKAVALGTVHSIVISKDHKQVIVKARMNREAKDIITQKTRFWVVRPRLSYGDLSGFETLVSGAYIQCDPGTEEGEFKTHFTGLEDPPGVTPNEPGTLFTLETGKLGQITVGSPVYFRDIGVGEVLHYDVGDGFEPIKISIFIHSPYDKFVHKETSFWNASGLSFHVGATGVQLQLQSLQSVIAGGISFSNRKKFKDTPAAPKDTIFKLYAGKDEAEIADMQHIAFVAYFQSAVNNIGKGTPVSVYGIQVGEVTGTKLMVNADTADIKARVEFQVEPERLLASGDSDNAQSIIEKMVAKGLRVKVNSGTFLPGQEGLSLDFASGVKQPVAKEGDAILIPASIGGGIDSTIENLADITRKIDQIPFAQIGGNLNNSLEGINQQSDLERSLKRTLDQVGDAAHSVRLLTDFLSVHPEALIRGRGNAEKQK